LVKIVNNMKLQEYFLKKAEIEQQFYSDNLTVEQALSQINSMIKTVEELELSEITVEDLNRNKRTITEYEEDNYDDEEDEDY
jgi:hypothetical protein